MNTIPDYWKPVADDLEGAMGDYTHGSGAEVSEERSPLNRVDRIARPLLIAQGANDVRVKASESEQIVAAMKRPRPAGDLRVLHDEGHGFMRPENRRSFSPSPRPFSVSTSAAASSRSATILRLEHRDPHRPRVHRSEVIRCVAATNASGLRRILNNRAPPAVSAA